MKRILIFIVGLLFIVGCSPKIIQGGTTKTIKEIVRDTTLIVKPDSAYYRAWVECRDNKPILVQKDTIVLQDTIFIARKGAYLQVPKVELKGNILKVETKADKQEIKAQIKEKTTIEVRTLIKEVEKKLSWWQTLFIWSGAILWLVIIVVGIIRLSPLGRILSNLIKIV